MAITKQDVKVSEGYLRGGKKFLEEARNVRQRALLEDDPIKKLQLLQQADKFYKESINLSNAATANVEIQVKK